MTFITKNFGQFAYFDTQLGRPNWKGKKVLDFGGNTGNVLKAPDSTIEPSLYWCIDVTRGAVEEGKAAHPEAHFLFYERYSFEFNSDGVRGLALPDVGDGFDYILALSVFTHTSQAEMLEFVPRLRALLNDAGTLAFTILDPHHAPDEYSAKNLRHYGLRDHVPATGELARQLGSAAVRRGDRFTLINDELHIGDDPDPAAIPASTPGVRDRYLRLYTPEAIRTLFPDVTIVPPVEPFARQHCCLLGKPKEAGGGRS